MTVLVILLAVLAVLQQRWITQLSDAQRAEMERGLVASATQFVRAFDGEVGRTLMSTRASGSMIRDNDWRSFADRYSAWLDTAEFADVVRDVLLVDYMGGRLHLRRWNQNTLAFEPMEWPDGLQRWRTPLEQALVRGRLVTPLLGGDHTSREFAFAPVLGRAAEHADDPSPMLMGFNIIWFDLERMRKHMFPVLAERYFTNANGDRYQFVITDQRRADGVVYASDPNAPLDLTQGITVDLVPLRENAQVLPPKYWLQVQHRPGVMQQAVTQLRQRNLAIGLGTLGLLSASIVVFVASSRRAQRLAREQIEVAAGVSHELRTPISVIRLAAQNLSQEIVPSDRIRFYGQMIETEADRLGEVVEGALLYASTTSERGRATRVPLAPATVIDAAIEAAGRAVPASRVDRVIAPDLPLVLGDKVAIQSALVNLISNAVKYGGPTGSVAIRADASAGRKPEVRITVEDCGPGIADHDLPHIFKPFYRGTAPTAGHARGNGLGLALVAQIVSAHDGRVTAVNRPGGGTAFTIALPALRHEPHEDFVGDASLTHPARQTVQS